MNPAAPTPRDLQEMLRGGDLRSIGRANEVVALVLGHPSLFAALVQGMQSDDAILKARCADAAEKLSAGHPDWLIPHQALLIEQLAGVTRPRLSP